MRSPHARSCRENLDVDMAYWRQRGRLKANATIELYYDIMKRHFLPAVFKVVLIYKVRGWRCVACGCLGRVMLMAACRIR